MQVFQGLEGLNRVPPGSVLTVGNFDGVHLGHRRLLARCRELADDSAPVVAVTFEPHPLTRLRPEKAPPRLTSASMKNRLIEEQGVDLLVELAPEPEVLLITAWQFFELLLNRLRVTHLVEGPDFSFGRGREGNIANLSAWASETAMRVHGIEEVTVTLTNLHVAEVRSSLIRWLVAYGRVRDAAICLGRAYRLSGPVVRGFGRGRQLGIPTANIDCGDQMIPSDGVYAGRCTIKGVTYAAGVSVGTLPTFNETRRQIEAHLIGFEGDLYDAPIELELLEFLRDQVRFRDIEQLKAKMACDLATCKRLAPLDPTRGVLGAAR